VGSGVAAVMRLEPGDEGDVPGGGLAQALSLGDAGAVEASDTDVQVVYVVREVVVRIEVVPASGEVDEALIDEVVEFAETTEAPIVEAVTGEAPPATEATTTTEEPTTTTEAAVATTAGTTDPTVSNSWSATAVEHREAIGEQFLYSCPPGGPPGTIWGTDVYTDDSSVCTAAVHAGHITVEDGGTVRIQMVPGQDAYPASERHGIVSQEWPEWPGSFIVLVAED
jgi:hypothetical protein